MLILCAFGCEDPVRISEDCHVHEDPDFVNSHFNFQVGTRWVYGMENSGERDTLSVYYHSPSLAGLNDFIWFARSTYRNYNYFQCYYAFIHGETNYTLPGCYRNVVNSGYETNGYTLNHASFLVSDKVGERTEYDFGCLEGIYNELELGSTTFQDVYVYLKNNDFTFNQDSVRYYVARDFGVVRFENLTNNQNWVLIESTIVR